MIQLARGDSFKLIRKLPDSSVNMVMTDVPYPDMTIHDGSRRIIRSDQWVEWFAPMAHEVKRVLKDDGSFFTTINSKLDRAFYFEWVVWMRKELGMHYPLTWYWVKENIIPGSPSRMKIPRDGVDFIAHFTKSPRFKVHLNSVPNWKDYNRKTTCPMNLIYASVKDDEAYWKAKKLTGISHTGKYPMAVPTVLIKAHTDPGDLVLEPFNGTGTTTLAAEKIGRHSIGFELNPRNVKLAKMVYRVENVPCRCTSVENFMLVWPDTFGHPSGLAGEHDVVLDAIHQECLHGNPG